MVKLVSEKYEVTFEYGVEIDLTPGPLPSSQYCRETITIVGTIY